MNEIVEGQGKLHKSTPPITRTPTSPGPRSNGPVSYVLYYGDVVVIHETRLPTMIGYGEALNRSPSRHAGELSSERVGDLGPDIPHHQRLRTSPWLGGLVCLPCSYCRNRHRSVQSPAKNA